MVYRLVVLAYLCQSLDRCYCHILFHAFGVGLPATTFYFSFRIVFIYLYDVCLLDPCLTFCELGFSNRANDVLCYNFGNIVS